MSAKGAFTFVLHSHLPYARLAGRWPHGEEWIHEAASETYIPLLQTLFDLREQSIPFRLTIGITPILAEQLADQTVLEHFVPFLDDRIAAARADMLRFAPSSLRQSDSHAGIHSPTYDEDPHLHYLADWYRNFYQDIKTAFIERFNRNIIAAFAQLQREGYIEIMTSAATHGYLPLFSRDSTIRAQIKTGIQSHLRMFGKEPTSIWLPECAYRPAYLNDGGTIRAGIESFLHEFGLKAFLSETHTITGGQPVGVATGDVIGPYGAIQRRYVIPAAKEAIPRRHASTYLPYYVSDTVRGQQADQHSGVAVIGRNNNTGHQVWSAEWGYPGDFDYREFHKKAGSSGLQYWRVTGAKTDLGQKDYYHPEWATFKIDQHAEHFAHMAGDLLRDFHQQTGKFGIIASTYDTELFGHWWFEGVRWLGEVLRHLAQNPDIQLMTLAEYISANPPQETLHIPESSWGAGGNHFTWDNGDTHWMWQPIHECEARMEQLANQYHQPDHAQLLVLQQAAREALLLQSSDWEFLVTTGQAREYAIQRFSQHVERFWRLATSLEKGVPDTAFAQEIYELDNVFPDIDYRSFRS